MSSFTVDLEGRSYTWNGRPAASTLGSVLSARGPDWPVPSEAKLAPMAADGGDGRCKG